MSESICYKCKNYMKHRTDTSMYRRCVIDATIHIDHVVECSHFKPIPPLNDSQVESNEAFWKKMDAGDYPRYCNMCGKKSGDNKHKCICKKCEKLLLKKGD